MKPVSERRGELMRRLSPEQGQKLLDLMLKLKRGIENDSKVPEEEQDFLVRNYEVSANSPCICGSRKTFRECCGKNSFGGK